MPRKLGLAGESVMLLVILAGLGTYLVPRSTSTIWTDSAWTAWMAPIANRLHDGQRLYSLGCHMPIPPLPPMLLYWTTNKATWFSESFACYVCGSLSLVLMFLGLHILGTRTPIPLLATLAAIPLHFSWLKLILYDELPFVWVAASFVVGAWLVRQGSMILAEVAAPRRFWLCSAILGVLCAFCVFSKQNVGFGLTAGSVAFLLVLSSSWRQRALAVAVFACGGTVATGGLLAVCAPHMSISGFVRDVFLTSAEVKGGQRLMLTILTHIAVQFALLSTCAIVPLAAVLGLSGRNSTPRALSRLAVCLRHPTSRKDSAAGWAALVCAAALGALAACLLESSRSFAPLFVHEEELVAVALGGGYLLMAFMAILAIVRRNGANLGLGALGFLLLPGVACFGLSGGRWLCNSMGLAWLEGSLPRFACPDVGYVFGFAMLFAGARGLERGGAARSHLRAIALPVIAFLLMFALWSPLHGRLAAARNCRERWSEIAFLKGTRTQASSSGMRTLVETVRRLAPGHDDRVLLLPEDPNAMEWFDRRRPNLSCAIVYFDQYWDRYVDDDFAKLVENPPQVIVIGPTEGLTWGAGIFGPEHDKRGTTRLLNRVRQELIPARYTLSGTQFINPAEQRNGVCIYLRKPLPPEEPTEGPGATYPRTTAARQ